MTVYNINVQVQANSLGEALERMGELPISFTPDQWQPWLLNLDIRPSGPVYASGGLVGGDGVLPVVQR